MIKRMIVIFSGSVLLIAAAVAVVVASRNRQPGLPPDVSVVASPAEVLVRAAREKAKPYAGTALYSLAEDKRATHGKY